MYAENNGVKIWYEIHGEGTRTLVMVHGFQVAPSEFFKRALVPFLSRHMRVVTLDLRGNGRSDRPEGGYDLATYVEDVHAVVEAAHLDRFAMAGHSLAVKIVIKYNATYPSRADQLILIGGTSNRVQSEDNPLGLPKEHLDASLRIWREQPETALKGFIELICSEKYSLRLKELLWEWAHATSPQIWETCWAVALYSSTDEDLKKLDIPVLLIHGLKDGIIPPEIAERLHEKINNSKLALIPDAGHCFVHTWPQVGRHIFEFLQPEEIRDLSSKGMGENPRILWLTSPIGMGHVKRDVAIASEMRKVLPDLTIHWLSVDPVRTYLETVGERIHPLSDALRNESAHIEGHTTGHSLDLMEALWEMDKILNNNFMVFIDAVREEGYDLVVGDESLEVAEYLHYNPTLKTAPFVFMTDFIGASNVSDDQTKQAHVYDFNGIWVEMREIHPEASDLSIYIGELENLPDRPFGEGLPNIRQWTRDHFKFSGYVIPFDPADYADRQALRKQLGFTPEDKILLVAVGGTAVGRPLIEKCLEAQPALKEKVPAIRTIVLCGPRIDPVSFGPIEDVEFQAFIPDPIRHYAACDLAVIQGGLSTAMELTALGRPFLYFPLKDHFEQQEYVDSRLKWYRAGMRMDFDSTNPSRLVQAIAANIGASVDYRPVNRNGAKRAASMIMQLFQERKSL